VIQKGFTLKKSPVPTARGKKAVSEDRPKEEQVPQGDTQGRM
jgi:hypothetical protein